MTVHKIKVEVSGNKDDRLTALSALIEGTNHYELKACINVLSTKTLISLAQCIHGKMYTEMRGY